MIGFIRGLFKKRPVEVEPESTGCEHDWETVAFGDIWEVCPKSLHHANPQLFYYTGAAMTESEEEDFLMGRMFGRIKRAENRVCLLCGECDNGIARMWDKKRASDKAIEDERQKQLDRAELAKKLWEDGCREGA